MQKKITIYFLY